MMELVTGGSGQRKIRLCRGTDLYAPPGTVRRAKYRNPAVLYRGYDPLRAGDGAEDQETPAAACGKRICHAGMVCGSAGKLSGAGLKALQRPGQKIKAAPVVLLECVSNLTANEMYEPGGAGVHTVERITEGVPDAAGAVRTSRGCYKRRVPGERAGFGRDGAV